MINMTILIVDDQISVVESMISEICWKDIGIKNILKAFNGYEAKELVRTNPIDIMLCDIEMPGLNGLDLFGWVKQNNYRIECIFLTSHADFNYAKQALNLGSFDYILQPARYGDIENAVKRAIKNIENKKDILKYYTYGRMIYEDKNILLDGILGGWIWGESRNYIKLKKDIKKLSIGLKYETMFYCSQLHLFNKNNNKQMDHEYYDDIFRYGLNNIYCEMCNDYKQTGLLIKENIDTYWILLFSDNLLGQQEYILLIQKFLKNCQKYFKCEISVYTGEAVNFDNVHDHYNKIDKVRKNNVTLDSKIFSITDNYETPDNWLYFNKEIWLQLILDGKSFFVAQEIKSVLHNLAAKNLLNAKTLQRFYYEFVQLIYKVSDNIGVGINNFIDKFDSYEQFSQGHKSLDTILEMIDKSMELINEFVGENNTDKNQMDIMIQYIHNNIEKDIKRSEVAQSVYLNPDYISRLFRKKLGCSFSEFVINEKMKVAQALLKTTNLPISVISLKVGYSNFSYFSKIYKRTFGNTPVSERKDKEAL